MKKIIFIILAFQLSAQSAENLHRKHSAHQHGSGQLSIAFDKNKGRAELKTSAASVIGFEHTAKTARHKKLQNDQLTTLESKISDMLQFETDLNCKISKEKIQIIKDADEAKAAQAEHSDVLAVFNIECAKSPAGSKITFNFRKFFKNLEDLDVQILVDDLQKSLEVKNTNVSVTLTP